MLANEYIVRFLRQKGVRHVFGYPGGMVTYLMDALSHEDGISQHLLYHEQGCSFAACGIAQCTGMPGVAYATSGPGATNMVTGIANAWFDSIPTLFLTGQVNTQEALGQLPMRQRGFQETDIVSVVKSITKFAARVERAQDIPTLLEAAYAAATQGRQGPALLDIPIDLQRAELGDVCFDSAQPKPEPSTAKAAAAAATIAEALATAKRPLIIAGAGVRSANATRLFRDFIRKVQIPVVTSMIGIDAMRTSDPLNMGFCGAYGHRHANFAIARCDAIFAIGTRLDLRQTGANRKLFAPQAKILRLDIDTTELADSFAGQQSFPLPMVPVLEALQQAVPSGTNEEWLAECRLLKACLAGFDNAEENQMVATISEAIPDGAAVFTDVGQNQVWVAQSFQVQDSQKIFFSGGLGAMGYSLPAAIGAAYATGTPTFCFSGDGGLQMNIQELQTLVRDRLPVKIILLNNSSLGMIRHFQEMYFSSRFTQTVGGEGYSAPDFQKVFAGYGVEHLAVTPGNLDMERVRACFAHDGPACVEVQLSPNTYVFPKLAMNRPIHDQEPLLCREAFNALLGPLSCDADASAIRALLRKHDPE